MKAISVSRFTVISLGPDVCTLLVPCSENICELFPLLPIPPPAKKPQNITVKRTYYSLNNRQNACSLEIEKAASEFGEGRFRVAEKILATIFLAPEPFRPLFSWVTQACCLCWWLRTNLGGGGSGWCLCQGSFFLVGGAKTREFMKRPPLVASGLLISSGRG